LTGDEFGADTALRLGLVQEVVQPGDEWSRAMKLAEQIAAQAPLAVAATLSNVRKAVFEGAEFAIAELDAVQRRLIGTSDAAEGVRSFVERRPARYTGH
jgi:enoyl-CoA hydratase/carnithine racemase